jgi:hypothetical protein
MSRRAYFLAFVVPAMTLVAYAGPAPPVDPLPSYLASRFKHSIVSWLNHHPGYRLATDADCSCADDITQVRAGWPPEWPPVPNYHPYYIVGDFRGDGAEDVAVGVISQQHPNKFRVLIIHGAPPNGRFYGAPRPQPWRLGVGPFESEGATFEPTHDGYRFSDEDDA